MLRISFTSSLSFSMALQNLSSLKLPFSLPSSRPRYSSSLDLVGCRCGSLMSWSLLREMVSSFWRYSSMLSFSMLLVLLPTGEEFISERMPMVDTIWLHLSSGVLLRSGNLSTYSLSMGVLHSAMSFGSGLASTSGSMGNFSSDCFLSIWVVNRLNWFPTSSTCLAKSIVLNNSYPSGDTSLLLGDIQQPAGILSVSILAASSAAIRAIPSFCCTSWSRMWLLKAMKSSLSWWMACRLKSCCDFSSWQFIQLTPFRRGEGDSLSPFGNISDSRDCSSGQRSVRSWRGLSSAGIDSFSER